MRSPDRPAVLCGCGPSEPSAPPAVPVVVAPVAQRDVRVVREFVGTTQGNVDARDPRAGLGLPDLARLSARARS